MSDGSPVEQGNFFSRLVARFKRPKEQPSMGTTISADQLPEFKYQRTHPEDTSINRRTGPSPQRIAQATGRAVAAASLLGVGVGVAADAAGVQPPQPVKELAGGLMNTAKEGFEVVMQPFDTAITQNTQPRDEETAKIRTAWANNRFIEGTDTPFMQRVQRQVGDRSAPGTPAQNTKLAPKP